MTRLNLASKKLSWHLTFKLAKESSARVCEGQVRFTPWEIFEFSTLTTVDNGRTFLLQDSSSSTDATYILLAGILPRGSCLWSGCCDELRRDVVVSMVWRV